jgi:ATP-dependent exoDNAse (exonuclease V) alpha subunit
MSGKEYCATMKRWLCEALVTSLRAKFEYPIFLNDDHTHDVQVLCPNRGGVGARSLNIELQAALNPITGDRKVERFGWTFAPGDKVMQIENDYDKEVYKGDIGYVDDVDPDENELTASFDGPRRHLRL